jgi:type IV pilus biogenesis protein CpaD/CtpE
MIQGKLPLVPVLLALLLLGCSSTSVRQQPVSRPRPKPTHTASPTARVTSESEMRKSLLKRVAGLNEAQAAAVLAGAGIPVENGVSAKFTLAKTVNKADSATLKDIAAHMP